MGLPHKDDVTPGKKKLNIDGLYLFTNDFSEDFAKGFKAGSGGLDISGKETIRFDKGIAYLVNSKIFSPGSVFIKNIKKIDDYSYEGIALIGDSKKFYEYKISIYKNGDDLVSKTHIPDGISSDKKPFIEDLKYYRIKEN